MVFMILSPEGRIEGFSERKENSFSFPVTEKAYNYILKENIEFLYETDNLDVLPPPDRRIGTADEFPKEHRNDFREGEHFIERRIREFAPRWNEEYADTPLDSMQALFEGPYPQGWKESSVWQADVTAVAWMKNTYPKWKIYSLAEDAAAMIAASRLDEDIELRPIYIVASSGHLFGVVDEILVYRDRTMWSIYIGLAFTPRLRLGLQGGLESKADEEIKTIKAQALRFVRTFIAAMYASNSPVEITDHQKQQKKKKIHDLKESSVSPNPENPLITYSTVYLSKRFRSIRSRKGPSDNLSKENLQKVLVPVSGFFRNQAYGPEHSLRKLIFVDGFRRGQWVKTGITYVTVRK